MCYNYFYCILQINSITLVSQDYSHYKNILPDENRMKFADMNNDFFEGSN